MMMTMIENKEKRKVGRPKGRRRNQYVCIPLHLEEKQVLQAASKESGISITAFIRGLVLNHLGIS